MLQLDGVLEVEDYYTIAPGLSELGGSGSLLVGGTMAMAGGGTATLGGNAEVQSGGAISGAGQMTVSGVLTLDVGSAVEVGSYTQQGAGTLVLQVASLSSYASLAVDGLAQLAGTLQLSCIDGYVPQTGDTLAVLTDGSLSGQFDTPPPGWSLSYGPTVSATKN